MKKALLVFLSALLLLSSCSGGKTKNNTEYIYLPRAATETKEGTTLRKSTYNYKYKYDEYGNLVHEEKYLKERFLFFSSNRLYEEKINKYTYDDNGRILTAKKSTMKYSLYGSDESYGATSRYEIVYNDKGQVIEINPIKDDDSVLGYIGTRFFYDDNGLCIKETKHYNDSAPELITENKYDSNGKLVSKTIKQGSTEEEYLYYYNEKELLNLVKYTSPRYTTETSYTYDGLDRVIKKEITEKTKSSGVTEKSIFEYKDFVKFPVPVK